MAGLHQLALAIANIGFSSQIIVVVWATLLGIAVGVIPGLTATLGIALVTTLTLSMDSEHAMLVLVCVYIGAIYGGGRTAILLNIPGTPANAASAMDGFPLARRGEAGRAMAVATTGSFLGSIVGMVGLAVIGPWLASVALDFTSFEYFWLAVFGVMLCGQLTAMDDGLKGWIAGFMGLLVAMVGQESVHDYARFTFGIHQLQGGFGLLPVLVGAFGCAEIFSVMRRNATHLVKSGAIQGVLRAAASSLRYGWSWGRSGVIGTFMGIVPGVGEDMGAWVSYAIARRTSKQKDEFGKGSVEGLLAAETGNNSAVPGALVPVLTLAIPGSAPAAVLLAAMIVHGVRPGPLIMIEQPGFFYSIVAMVFWASCAMLVLGLTLTRPLLLVLRVRREWLMGLIFVLCAVGAFAVAGRVFDVWVMVGFGVLGFLMRETGFPVPPMILGVVLGPILDDNLRRSLSLTQGHLLPFVTRPISAFIAFMIVMLILLSLPSVTTRLAAFRRGRNSS